MNKDVAIFVAGHRGLVGSAIVRCLEADGYRRIIVRTRDELDLRRQQDVECFFEQQRPDLVFLAAATVGGIHANDTYPADFIRDNLLIQTNVIDSSYRKGVKKLLFLGSSCIYPKLATQPMSEDALLTGPLEPTNRAYAVAKIAGIEMVRSYRRQHDFNAISAMPTNLYGPNDNFDAETSHVLAALMARFHHAKAARSPEVVVWGTGQPRREFLHVNDLARACVFLMEHYDSGDLINVGVGKDLSIRELAELMSEVVGFRGTLRFDPSKPDGTPRKLLDVSRIHAVGWEATIPLHEGLQQTYEWYMRHLTEREHS